MNSLDKQLGIAFKILSIFCLCLLSTRFINSISFLEPLHVQTGGAEDTSFIGIWFFKNGNFNYDHFLKFGIDIENSNIFSLFHYNWLFYTLNALSVNLFQFIFDLNDLWIPTIVRITCFILSLFCVFVYYKSLNQLNKSDLSFFLSLYLFLGPLTGYWVISGKPDIFYIFFETFAIYLILKTINKQNIKNVIIITFVLYLSWSVKQNSIVTISSFALFLLWRRNFKLFFILFFEFLLLLILTKIFGPNKLFESIFWQGGSALSFNVQHFLNVFLDSVSKGLVIYFGLICFFLNLISKKHPYKYLKSLNSSKIFLFIGAILSTSQIFFSFHFGSAVNYYYIFFIYAFLFLHSEIKNFLIIKKIKIIFISGIYLQIILIIFIFLGLKGSVTPIRYLNITEFKNCVKNMPSPILSDHKPYYRLPWITPDGNPILRTMMYENFTKNTNLKDTPLYKAVKNGEFKTLILSNPQKYNLKNYKFLKNCKSLKNMNVKIYLKN